MKMNFPEEEIIELINALATDTCSLPCNTTNNVSPSQAADLRQEGLELKRSGDLVGANEKFIEMFHRQDTICSDGLWSWAKVLLLAKDFRNLQLLMHAEYANYFRGESWFSPFEWMNMHLNLPGFEINWSYDGPKQTYEIISLNYFENPEQLVERFYAFGGNDGYWRFNYSWSPDDYRNFLEYFGPIAILAIEDTKYRWTNDDYDDLLEMYESIISDFAAKEEKAEQEEFQYDPNYEYVDEGGMPVLPSPDEEICDLIDKLEGNCCELPDAGNPPMLEGCVPKLYVDATRMMAQGNLHGAHSNYLEIFKIQESLSSQVLYDWVRVFLLAKDFGHAQLVLHLSETNAHRGQRGYFFEAKTALDRLLSPPIPEGMKPEGMAGLQQIMQFLADSEVDFNDREALAKRIAEISYNEAFWAPRYTLSKDEHRKFIDYFGKFGRLYKSDYQLSRRSY